MKLLLAIDDSPFSVPPARAVVHRPWPAGSVVRIVTVAEVPLPVAPEFAMTANVAATRMAHRRAAEATVQKVRETIAKAGLTVETSIREGKAGPEIVEEAKAWGPDLILMGSHGRTGVRRFLVGSVAQYVVSHALCSVEVVRGAAPESTAALRGAAREENTSEERSS